MKTVYLLFVAFALGVLFPESARGQGFGFTTSFAAGYVDARSRIKLRRNTFAVQQNIWYHTGAAWQQLTVGPASSDLYLDFTPNYMGYNGYPLGSRGTFAGLNLVGATTAVTCPATTKIVNISTGTTTGGPFFNINCDQSQIVGTVTRGASGNSSFIHNMPDITLTATYIEGQLAIIPGGGMPPDHDGDGMPDETDPDDDNDGISDGNDDFPKDPNENNDNDGDGQGDNADPDDDNDGHPDGDDSFPYDPGQWKPDTDGDGRPDDVDKFPNNPREWDDNDNDGIGGNTDPDDGDSGNTGGSGGGGNTPPGGNGGSGEDGEGDPPPVGPGGGGDMDGDGELDIMNDASANAGWNNMEEVKKPGVLHNVVEAWQVFKGAVQNKFANFTPLGTSVIPKTMSYQFTVQGHGRFPGINETIDFSVAPWPQLRGIMLAFIIAALGFAFMKKISI